MTPEQIVGMIGKVEDRPDIENAQREQLFQIRALVDAAVREEREACAKVSDSFAYAYCSEAIRARGDK